MEVHATISLNGIDDKLAALGAKLAKSTLQKAIKMGAKILEDEAKARAPVDTGDLRASIKTITKMNAKQESGRATVGPTFNMGTKAKPNKGAKDQSPGVYGLIVELGNKRQSPQPFLRPTFDTKKEAVVEKVAQELWKGIEEAAK